MPGGGSQLPAAGAVPAGGVLSGTASRPTIFSISSLGSVEK
jgi:hypothetical protein